MSQITVQVEWLNNVPETEIGKIHEVALRMIFDFCEEMTDSFLVFGKYTPVEEEDYTMVQVEGHLFMRVHRQSLVLYIPDECLDVDVMIEVMNNVDSPNI